jgi:hypothetical protein
MSDSRIEGLLYNQGQERRYFLTELELRGIEKVLYDIANKEEDEDTIKIADLSRQVFRIYQRIGTDPISKLSMNEIEMGQLLECLDRICDFDEQMRQCSRELYHQFELAEIAITTSERGEYANSVIHHFNIQLFALDEFSTLIS